MARREDILLITPFTRSADTTLLQKGTWDIIECRRSSLLVKDDETASELKILPASPAAR